MSDTILDEVREILQKSPTTSFGQGYVIGLVAELEATQSVLSRAQEARADGIARSEKAEAENVRLTKMADWLAGRCAEHCEDKGPNPRCSVAVCTIIHCNKATAEEWKESARRAVADTESPENMNKENFQKLYLCDWDEALRREDAARDPEERRAVAAGEEPCQK